MRNLTITTVLMAMALTGCEQKPKAESFCVVFNKADLPNQKTLLDRIQRCIAEQAYRMALSSGSNEDAARATLYAGGKMIDEEVTTGGQLLTHPDGSTDFEAIEEWRKEQRAMLTEQAFFRVVQARAGHCAPPPKDYPL